jgi:hypothetical protein
MAGGAWQIGLWRYSAAWTDVLSSCQHFRRRGERRAPPTSLYSWFVFKEDVMGDKSPKNINKQKKDHGKKKEEQKKKPAVSSIKK